MDAWIDSLNLWLSLNPHWLGAAIFLAACLECLAVVGLLIPGTVLLFAVAVLAGGGVLELWQVLLCLAIAGLGSGALVAAMPAAAAAAAPRGQTGVASALTNTTKTVGGTMSSAVFGVVLAGGAGAVVGTAAPFAGYVTVWVICSAGGFLAAILLFFVPKVAFADAATDARATAARGDLA